MKITRKGNPKGLDIDYEVTNITPEEADELHKSLLKKDFLFTYSNKGVYEPPTENVILHYIDKDLKLYDYAILFTKQERSPKKVKDHKSPLDLAYDRARTDAEFKVRLMEFMRYEKLLTAFSKYIDLHGELKGKYLTRFKKVLKELKEFPLPTEYTPQTLKQLSRDLFKVFLA
jgi:hypothetical protein